MQVITYLARRQIFENKQIYEDYYNKLPLWRVSKIDKMQNISAKTLSLAAGVCFYNGLCDLNIDPSKADIDFNIDGKPYIKNINNIFFNISHSKDVAICSFASSKVGCDIEKLDKSRIKIDIVDKIASKEEEEYFNKVSSSNKEEEIYKLWTYKESFIKYKGSGLKDIKNISIYDKNGNVNGISLEGNKIYFKNYAFDDYRITVCSDYNDFAEEIVII